MAAPRIIAAPLVDVAASPYTLGYPLPPSARPDLAIVATLALTATSNTLTYMAEAGYTDLPLALTANYTTDSTAGNRTMNVVAKDPAGTIIWSLTAPAVQAPTTVVTYALLNAISTSLSVSATMQIPLSNVPLAPASTLTLLAAGSAAGDSWSKASITVLRVPTGPQLTVVEPSVPATPLLV